MCVTWHIPACLVRVRGRTHPYVWRDYFHIIRSCVWCGSLHVSDMTRLYAWHDWFLCVTLWLDSSIWVCYWHVCVLTSNMCVTLMDEEVCFLCVCALHIFVCVTDMYVCSLQMYAWLYDMTHPYVWFASFVRIILRIRMCAMTHFMWMTWLVHTHGMTHSRVWLCDLTHPYVCVTDMYVCSLQICVLLWWMKRSVSCVCVHFIYTCVLLTCMCARFKCMRAFVTWLIHMCDMPHLCV